MKRRLTFEIEIEGPDEFQSFDDLEQFVFQVGQRVQRRLCRELAEEATEAMTTPSCPKCDSHSTIAKGRKQRRLKTCFGEIEVPHPRHLCKECGHSFFG